MKVSVLGNTLEDLNLNLLFFLPRAEIELIICDNHPFGLQKVVQEYSNKNNIDYVIYKLEDYEFEDEKKLRKFYIKYKTFTFPRNDLTVYHSDYIILFKIDENPYVHYIEKLAKLSNKKIRIEYLVPKKKFSRDSD
ncbi:MAG: hypothetical protein KatS3mg068_0715 [Candidatus Sericytochromatia bacterium]|nr:MAG: hypothetical protein KatS3mg068_0715 [Candidatus Sericytochromatia bacterium]